MVNALKYVSKFGPTIAVLAGSGKNVTVQYAGYLVFQMIATLFCLYWDLYMDWGLFRGTRKNNRILRDKMKYAPSYYYFCMVLNTLLRFFWLIGFFHLHIDLHPIENHQTYEHAAELASLTILKKFEFLTWASMVAEGVRRGFWSTIRVENEFLNNFENYRDLITIPPIKDE